MVIAVVGTAPRMVKAHDPTIIDRNTNAVRGSVAELL